MPGVWLSLSHNWATARTIAGDASTIWQPGLLLKPVAIELGLATGLSADQAIGLAGDGSQPHKPSFAQQSAGFWAVATFAATSTLGRPRVLGDGVLLRLVLRCRCCRRGAGA